MKRILSLICAITLILTALSAGIVSTSAAVSYDTTVKVGSAVYYADKGDTFTYTVSIKAPSPVCAGQLSLPVNFSVLSGDSEAVIMSALSVYAPNVADTALIQRFDTASSEGVKGYVLNFATDSAYDFTFARILLTMNFKVLKAGTVTLDPTLSEFLDANLKDITSSVTVAVSVGLTPSKSYSVKAPDITGITPTAKGLRISWGAVSGAGNYRVFRWNNSKWTTLSTQTGTSYDDNTVESGKTYTYTVRVTNSSASGWLSDYVHSGWSATFFAPPSVRSFDSLQDGLKLSWKPLDGAYGYRVYRHNGSKWKIIADTTDDFYIDTDAVQGNSYKYTIRVIDQKGDLLSYYNTSGFTGAYLGAPVLLSASTTYGGISVKWDAMNGAEKYRVFRKTEDTGWYKISDTTDVTFIDRIVDPDISYTYTVRCISADASRYTSRYDADGLTAVYHPAPAVTDISNTAEGASISWSAVEGAEKYRLFRKANGSGWKIIVSDTSDLSFVDANVTAGTSYTYTVRTLTPDGSAYLSGYYAAGWTNIRLSAPVITSVANKVGYVQIRWDTMPGAAKYRVFRKQASGGWKRLGDTTGVYWYDKTAVSGNEYIYTVRCITYDGTAFTSPYDTAGRSITYIAAPTLTSVTKVTGGVKIIWSSSDGAVKYRVFRKTGSGGWKKLGDTAGTSWTNKSVTSGTTYTYTVRCISEDGSTYTSAYTSGKTITY